MPVGPYSGAQTSIGNGVTTVFPYGWKILDQAHLQVKADGVVKMQGADYTVDGVGNSNGGNVTFLVAPANGVVIERSRVVPYKRDVDYQTNGDLKEETLDADLDIEEMQIQQVAAAVARAFKAPNSVTADQVLADAVWALKGLGVPYAIGFDGAGTFTLLGFASPGTLAVSAFIQTLLDDADAATARATLGAYGAGSTLAMAAKSILEAEGAAVASAASCNIWGGADGNTVHVTGNTGITDFGTAPQAGAWMKVIFDGTPTLTQSANLNLNGGGANITVAADDMALVYADTTTQMDVFVIKKDGTSVVSAASSVPPGAMQPYGGISTPAGWLLCDGSSVARAAQPTLWAAISATKGVATLPVASPGIVNFVGHGLTVGDAVSFTTAGTLPTGVVAGTTYYVITAGLTANAFEIAATQGGAAINFTGASAGAHTLIHNPWGTPAATPANFLLPDMKGRTFAGKDNMGGAAANRLTAAGSGVYGANLGSVGGAETHALTSAQNGTHTHGAGSYAASGGLGTGGSLISVGDGVSSGFPVTGTSGSSGSGTAHNNTQPVGVGNWIIKT